MAAEILVDCLVFEWIKKQSTAECEDDGGGDTEYQIL